jgi:hypothetical protein
MDSLLRDFKEAKENKTILFPFDSFFLEKKNKQQLEYLEICQYRLYV